MVKIINARTAGYRLAGIVAVLLIPILFMGANIGWGLRQELNTINREMAGADYMNLIGPVMLDAVNHAMGSNAKTDFSKHGAERSAVLGLNTENSNLEMSLKYANPDYHSVLKQTVALAQRIGVDSHSIYEAHPESYHVLAINSDYLPLAISDFYHLRDVVLSASENEVDQNANQIILAIGNFSSSTERMRSAILAASQASENSGDYDELILRAELIKKDMSRLSETGMGMSMSGPVHIKTELIGQINLVNKRWVSDFRFESERLRQRASALLGLKHTEIINRILRVLLMSLAAVLLGLGSAIAMYRSTLRQLDQVETAKILAELARVQAEHMSAEVSSINDNMVRVNAELANNMQMLKDAQDALVKKGRMEQMGQLTATIAHELRNPLGAVRTSTFLIERKIKGKELGIEPQIARINNGVTRCDDIITQLLDFSRSKKLSCRSENLDEWLEKVISEEAIQLPAAVAIDCLLGLKDLHVPFDPSRLQRAIINLISNASEALVGNGENQSRYASAAPCITITTSADSEFAMISVRDNGPGIKPENLEKIREPLFTTKSFGTGLGLPAVEQIVVQHGGTLEITSAPGEGANFTIKLPLRSSLEDAA